ncbi:MAG: IS1595 family transposase [Chloroflexi bacterium]|nr:IS1595 family transposase [Chloroflexota bacterium]
MAHKAPGKHYRRGISLVKLMEMFPDDATAEAWFASVRWDGKPVCPFCESERVRTVPNRKPMPYRCRDCRKHFSVKHGTVMQSSKLGCRVWAIAVYLLTTGIKGTSGMKLHRDLDVTYKTAWHLAHRIRKAFPEVMATFAGPVEVDETAIGGLEKNKHANKKTRQGRGTVGKTIVVGVLDRPTNQVVAGTVAEADARTLQGKVLDATDTTAQVYTDDAGAYRGIARKHEAVSHSTGEYVREQAHTNGIESFWALLDRGIMGTFHHVSPKHLDRYVTEFAGRHNQRPLDTVSQMERVAGGMVGERLRYRDLTN